MRDPLSEIVALLEPSAVFARRITGAGRWEVRYTQLGEPSFCAVLDGRCMLAVDGYPPVVLQAGDFVLLPATPGFTTSSYPDGGERPRAKLLNPHEVAALPIDEIRYGDVDAPADVNIQGGHFVFGSPNPALLMSLLPGVVHVHDATRLSLLVKLVGEEVTGKLPGHDFAQERLVQLLLIEALRATSSDDAPPGLLRGLADPRLAPVMRQMHAQIAHPWNMEQLAGTAALSRSNFFDRFKRTVGVPPMEYLLTWRMAVAKDLLRKQHLPIAVVAERVGYSSASTFSTAFSRHVGEPPSQFARET